MPSWLCNILLAVMFCQLVPSTSASCSNATSSVDEMVQYASALVSEAPRGPLTMVLPEDSEFTLSESEAPRRRRHVICGKNKKKKSIRPLSFEQRSVCPFRHYKNVDHTRIPVVLEEVRCVCDRPSHVSSYTEIRCEPLQYRLPVLRLKGDTGIYEQDFELLTMACIPLKPREEDDFLVPLQTSVKP